MRQPGLQRRGSCRGRSRSGSSRRTRPRAQEPKQKRPARLHPSGRRSHGNPGALQGLDSFRKRGERQVAFGAHHARAADLERQARIGGGFQLGHDIAEHLQHARQAIGAEQRQLIGKLAALRRADVERHIGPCQAHHVQIAHVLGKLAHELRQIGAGFNELRHPVETRRGIALAQRLHDVGQIAGVHAAEHALGNGQA